MKQAKVLLIPTLIGCVALANAQTSVITSVLSLNALGFQDSKKSSDSGGDRQKSNRNDRSTDRNSRSRGDRGGSDRSASDRGGSDRNNRGGEPTDRIRPDQNASGRDYGRPSGGNGNGGNGGDWGWSGSGRGNGNGNGNGDNHGSGGGRGDHDHEYDHGNGRGGGTNVIIVGGSSGRPYGRPYGGTPNCYRGGGWYIGLNWHFADEPRRINGCDWDDQYDFEITQCGRPLNYNWDERPYRLNGVVMVAFNRTASQLRNVSFDRDRDARLVYLYQDRDVIVHREGTDEFRLNGRLNRLGERSEDRHGTFHVPLDLFSTLLGTDIRVHVCN